MEDNNHNYISDEDLAAFLDGNVSEDEMSRILSSLADNPQTAEILSLSPEIDKAVLEENNRLLPMWALAAANPENLCSFECEAFILRHLDFDIDHWSLLEEAKANNWVREEGTPLHLVGKLLELKGLFVERKYDASIKDLVKAIDSNKQVITIVDKNIIDGNDDANFPSYHAIYVAGVENDDVKYLNPDTLLETFLGKDAFKKAWKVSGNYMVIASKDAHGYNPQPINVEDIDLDANLEELTEAIAENAHDIWARARMDEGWTYGPVRNDELKHHPDLIPYAQLPDSEKEYDRIMAMNTLRLVRRLGFDITNRNID
ncbi:MAG: RyR domain-containing protein [Muribaculum sp.]|nr:RyR domain-containing protein [Muribaculum sp.]